MPELTNKKNRQYDRCTPVKSNKIWSEPVVLSQVLNEIESTIHRFIACVPETAQATALWIALTWVIDAVHVVPIAVITAPEKRCGKTQLLTLIGKLVPNPLASSNITASAMFRVIERDHPTLLIDEADTFLKDENTRGILNAGHSRENAFVYRSDPKTFEPRRFDVFGAKAIAGIGRLAETLMDRSILLVLRRKLPTETVERLRHVEEHFQNLKARLARFAEDYFEAIESARPNLPDELNDRAQDNWEPLLAIADLAGEGWSEKARKAALKISGTEESVESTNTQLLTDIREIFESKGIDRLATYELLGYLCADEEKPWVTYNRGRQISARQIAERLKSFGISSRNIRIKNKSIVGVVLRGYYLSQFQDAFARYLPTVDATELQFSVDEDSDVAANSHVAPRTLRSGSTNPEATCKTTAEKGCSVVTLHPRYDQPDLPLP
jgi:putative DNA primase/helicase